MSLTLGAVRLPTRGMLLGQRLWSSRLTGSRGHVRERDDYPVLWFVR